MQEKKILIACEYSNTVAKHFRALGNYVVSCDLLPNDESQEFHYQGDVFDIIDNGWDVVIAFPPCTHLATSGAKHFAQKVLDGRQQEGIDFFMKFTRLAVPMVAIENPIGIMSKVYRKPDQIVNPYDFGDAARKPTCLWLKGLPKLQATNLGDAPLFGESLDRGEMHITKGGNIIPKWYNLPPSEDRGKLRSKFFEGMARAMAEQWTRFVNKA